MFQRMMGRLLGTRQQLAGDAVLRSDSHAPVGRSKSGLLLQPMLRASVALVAFVAVPVLSAGLNDTGITACSDGSNNMSAALCAGVSVDTGSHPRQDATKGRDAQASAGTLVKIGGGGKGFDFSKIANDGSVLNANATSWSCTKDNVTGLTWEVKTTAGLHSQNNTYSWYQGGVGVENRGACSGTTGCDTAKFVADVNAAGLCGASDWRMPTLKELEGLVDFGIDLHPSGASPIDPAYFPNTPADYFWTDTMDATRPGQYIWLVDFMGGNASRQQLGNALHVRLVRGISAPSQFVLTDSDTTVTDNSTGLMWKRDYEMLVPGQPQPFNSLTPDRFTWQAALARSVTDRTGSHSDWRLPNVKELRSLIDETHASPAINPTFFPAPLMQSWFWSSSPFFDWYWNPLAWVVNFDFGQDQGLPPTGTSYVRLVRDGALAVPTVPLVPGAPNIGAASPLDSSASISFSPPVSNGSTASIDSFMASCVAGGSTRTGTASGSPITVPGLTNRTAYSCTVQAHNSNGYGAASASVGVTPVPAACSYALNKSTDSSSAIAFHGNVTVSTACGWTAASNNPDWLTVAAGSAAGNGNGSVTYSATANPSATARTGTLTIAGQTFTITQAGNCSVTLSAISASFASGGGAGSFTVTTVSSCSWGVASNDSWITVTPTPLTAAANSTVVYPTTVGTVSYSVDPNPGPTRTGTLTIAGQTFTVTQTSAAVTGTVTGTLITRYRLYNDVIKEHLYTTDANEYSVLSTQGWVAEGRIYNLFQGAGSYLGVTAVPYYRLSNPSSGLHHWTTDQNEYNVLGTRGWTKEGIDGYILPTAVTGTLPLYRLYLNAFGGLHLWTVDANEKTVLTTTAGWADEGIAGYVIPLQ